VTPARPSPPAEREPCPIDERVPKHEPILAWYPHVKLDDDYNLTDEVVGGSWHVVVYHGGKHWEEPTYFEAAGGRFGDDWNYAEAPTHWMRLPGAPT